MAILLDEDRIGSDLNQIGYPHLLLCMGVTVRLSDGSLVGAHVTDNQTEEQVMRMLLREVSLQLGKLNKSDNPRMLDLYVTGNWTIHKAHSGEGLKKKASALGFKGDVYSFDTSLISPRDGTFVTVVSNGKDHKATIKYKQNDKMKYKYGEGASVIRVSRMNIAGENPQTWIRARKEVTLTKGYDSGIQLKDANLLNQVKHVVVR